MKRILITLITFILLVLGLIGILRFVAGGGGDTWVCVNGVWVKHGQPSSSPPESGCGE